MDIIHAVSDSSGPLKIKARSTQIRFCLKTESSFLRFKQNRVHTLRLLIVFAQPPSLIEACAFTGIQHRDVIVFKSLRFKPSTRVQNTKVGYNRDCGSQFWPPSCVR